MLGCLLAAGFLSIAAPTMGAAPPDEEKALEEFLARLGLAELQIAHLEDQVDAAPAGPQQTAMARRLADLYASRLMSSSDNKERYDDTLRRIKALTTRVPAAKTASLGVILLQADYNRAESLVSKWIADQSQTKARDEGRTILQKIGPELAQRRTQLKTARDALIDQLDKLPNEDPRGKSLENQLGRLEAVLGRASYFAAWSNYYLGVLGGSSGTQNLVLAQQIFRDVLGVEGEYAKAEPEWMSLESVWRARAVIGLGLTEAARGNLTASDQVFQWLRHASVPPEIQDQGPYWYVRGLLNANKLNAAAAFAQQEIQRYGSKASQGKVSLCVALVRAGFGAATKDETSRRIGMLGITGLAKLGQQKAIDQLVSEYKIPLDSAQGFFLNWIQGRKLAAAARESKDKAKFAAAAKALEQALAAPEARTNAAAAAQCRYELAWTRYQQEQWEPAARDYRQAQIGLRAAGDAAADDAAWMAFVAYRRLAKNSPRYATQAIQVLQDLKRDFPKSEYARKADYFIRKMQRVNSSPQETIQELQKTPPDSPSYLAARYDLCTLLHQQWAAAKSTAEKDNWARQLSSAVDVYLKAAGEKESRRRLRCLLLAAEVALQSAPPNLPAAAERLQAAERLTPGLPSSDALAAEFHFRALQLAGRRRNEAQRTAHADWLVKNAAGSAYEVPALVISARSLEAEYRARGGAPSAALLQVYKRLVNRLGASPATLANNKNARVAASRYASHLLAANQPAPAVQQLENLVQAFPKNTQYLRRAGLAAFQAGQHEQALEHWRKLVRGLPKTGPEWYEAKYYQIASLARTDRAAAQRSLKQFKLLYPTLGGKTWQPRFAALSKQLGG